MSSGKDYRESHMRESKALKYDELIYAPGSYDDFIWKFEKLVLENILRNYVSYHDSSRYLDFACGTGRITELSESFVDDATGVDISSAMINRAKSKTKKTSYILADLTSQDTLEGESYDIITAFRFFLNAEVDLRERVMHLLQQKMRNEDSILIFNIHGHLYSHRIITKLWYWMKGRTLHTMSRRSIELLVSRNGLRVDKIYVFGILPKIFYRLLPQNLMYKFDCTLSKIPICNYFAYDLIYQCSKSRRDA